LPEKDKLHNLVDLTGRHVLVTGASSGIGRQCAIVCAGLGATVSLFGRDEKRLEATRLVMDEPDRHRCYSVDLTDGDRTQQAVEAAMQHAGRFGGFIHSAGVQHSKPLNAITRADLNDLFAVNVIAAFDLLRLVCSKKRRAEGLACVLLASVRAHAGEAGIVTYSASKGALVAGARSAAAELARYGVRVNTVSPGYVASEMASEFSAELPAEALERLRQAHPLGLGSPQDVAGLCAFLLSDAARWVTGADYLIDGGYLSAR